MCGAFRGESNGLAGDSNGFDDDPKGFGAECTSAAESGDPNGFGAGNDCARSGSAWWVAKGSEASGDHAAAANASGAAGEFHAAAADDGCAGTAAAAGANAPGAPKAEAAGSRADADVGCAEKVACCWGVACIGALNAAAAASKAPSAGASGAGAGDCCTWAMRRRIAADTLDILKLLLCGLGLMRFLSQGLCLQRIFASTHAAFGLVVCLWVIVH